MEENLSEIYIYWKDVYSGGYRKGVSHASKDGGVTLCGRKIEKMEWDGGYSSIEEYDPECKLCVRKLPNPK